MYPQIDRAFILLRQMLLVKCHISLQLIDIGPRHPLAPSWHAKTHTFESSQSLLQHPYLRMAGCARLSLFLRIPSLSILISSRRVDRPIVFELSRSVMWASQLVQVCQLLVEPYYVVHEHLDFRISLRGIFGAPFRSGFISQSSPFPARPKSEIWRALVVANQLTKNI